MESAARKAELKYPIALDNDFSTWNAFENQYWPASYLIDKEGNVRRVHAGEGEYKETEQAIRMLLGENGGRVPAETTKAVSSEPPTAGQAVTPETYLGTKRASNYVGSPSLIQGERRFTPGDLDRVNAWTLGGTWNVNSEGITAVENSKLTFRFAAKEVYLITGNAADRAQIKVLLDGKPISDTGMAGEDVNNSTIELRGAQLYKAVRLDMFSGDKKVEFEIPAGVQLNVFTFG